MNYILTIDIWPSLPKCLESAYSEKMKKSKLIEQKKVEIYIFLKCFEVTLSSTLTSKIQASIKIANLDQKLGIVLYLFCILC